MNKDIIENMLVSSARKAMLENVDSIDDIKFLQKELKTHLRNEFDLQHQLEEKDKAIDEAINFIKNTVVAEYGSEEIINIHEFWFVKKIKEILERGKNVNSK